MMAGPRSLSWPPTEFKMSPQKQAHDPALHGSEQCTLFPRFYDRIKQIESSRSITVRRISAGNTPVIRTKSCIVIKSQEAAEIDRTY